MMDYVDNKNNNIIYAQQLLKWTYGLVYIIAGFDKVLHTYFIVDWTKYISPYVSMQLTHIGCLPEKFLLIVGVLEIILGILTLIYTKFGAYLTAFWLILICVNLFGFGFQYLDIIVRDLGLAVGATALAWLS